MQEQALRFGRDRSLVGILNHNPAIHLDKNNGLTGVLLLNAGLIHHVGPSRFYVKTARRLATEGFVVVRFDFSGIGDSGPRMDKLPATESVIDETQQVMDHLEERMGVKQFVCIGLCAGAAAAAQVFIKDRRVRKAILLNPVLPKTSHKFLTEQTNIYRKLAIFNIHSWHRFFSMRSNYRRILHVVSAGIKKKLRPNSFGDRESQAVTDELKRFFHSLIKKGEQVFILYSEMEFVDEYLQIVLGNEYIAIKNSDSFKLIKLTGADHLITPYSCQEEVLNLISKILSETP